jgi:hypothetical protein
MFSDDEGFASVAFLSPAVTPWRSTLAPETGANNPGLRLVQYDSNTGEAGLERLATLNRSFQFSFLFRF